jgi:putative effector of murein hydrolase
MKEASGEANMTVVTIILIGIIVAVATPIVTNMMNNTKKRTDCMNNGGYWTKGQCKSAAGA